MLAPLGLYLALPHSHEQHKNAGRLEALLESTESLIESYSDGEPYALFERENLDSNVQDKKCPDGLKALTDVIRRAFPEGTTNSVDTYAGAKGLTTEKMQSWMTTCMKDAWAEAGLDSDWFKAKVNYVFKSTDRDVDKMKAAGQLRSQYLCFNTLPWATWTYHPSLGYSDCVFKNDVEKGVTQEIVYVPSTYWSDCNSVNKVVIPTSEEVNDNIIKCNVKADGSVTLLSDLDFQVRCCQGQYEQDPKDGFGAKGPLGDDSCDPRAFSGKSYLSSSAEICIAEKLTKTSSVPVDSFIAPPGVALDTNWYPGDFANVGAYDGLSCGKPAVAPARVAVSLFALLNGVAVAAKDFGIPDAGSDETMKKLLLHMGPSTCSSIGGCSVHNLRIQALANVKEFLTSLSLGGMQTQGYSALSTASTLFSDTVQDFDTWNKARADAEAADPTPPKKRTSLNYKTVCTNAAKRDDLFFKEMQKATNKLKDSSHTIADGATFCEEIMTNLIYANEAYLVKGALKGLKLKLDNQLDPIEMLENLAQNLGMGLEHTAEETEAGADIGNPYKVGDGIIKYGKYFKRALEWTQKTGTITIGTTEKTISNAKEGPGADAKDRCKKMDGGEMIKQAKQIFPKYDVEKEMTELRKMAKDLIAFKKAAGAEEKREGGDEDALVDMAYKPATELVSKVAVDKALVFSVDNPKEAVGKHSLPKWLVDFMRRVLKLTTVLTAAMLKHIFSCPSLTKKTS